MTLGEIIRTHRVRLRLSQTQLGQRIGVSQSCVGAWERNVNVPTLPLRQSIAAALKVPYPELAALFPPQPERSLLGQFIQTRRVKLGLLQQDLAAMMGVDYSTASTWELGSRIPHRKQLQRLAEILRVPLDTLLVVWFETHESQPAE